MPIFSRHWTSQPDREQLRVHGPALQVEVSIPTELAAALQNAGQAIPPPHGGIALIDTGASITGVDEGILQGLGLSPTSTAQVSVPSGSVTQPVYACVLSFPGIPLPAIPFNQVIGSQLAGMGYAALIGRDILQYCLLVYNGPEGVWTIAY